MAPKGVWLDRQTDEYMNRSMKTHVQIYKWRLYICRQTDKKTDRNRNRETQIDTVEQIHRLIDRQMNKVNMIKYESLNEHEGERRCLHVFVVILQLQTLEASDADVLIDDGSIDQSRQTEEGTHRRLSLCVCLTHWRLTDVPKDKTGKNQATTSR